MHRMKYFDRYLESFNKNLLVKKMPPNGICRHLNTDIYYGKPMDLLNEKNKQKRSRPTKDYNKKIP